MATIKRGSLTAITAGYGEEAQKSVGDAIVTIQLNLAQTAYRNGNLEGVRRGAKLWVEYRTMEPLPLWLREGLCELFRATPRSDRRGGRHARQETRRRDDVADWIRAWYIDALIDQYGVSFNAACREASEALRGDPGGTPKVMAQAHKRFHDRAADDPSRFYPFLGPVAYLLQQARK